MEDGIKTFPFPTKLDDRIKMIELEFGIQGYAVVWKLHQAIYSVGYYLKWDIDTQLLFINDYRLSMVGRNLVSEIVASCLRRGVFESSLYEKYQILTSERIQETFLTAKARNKKVIVNKDYALPVVYTFIENASKSGKNVNIFWKNADISEQKKRKEKKGNKYTHIESEPRDFETQFKVFCDKWKITVDNYSPLLAELDFDKLNKAYKESAKFLQVAPVARTISWVIKNAASIYASKYKDKKDDSGNEIKKSKGCWDDALNKLGRLD